MVSFRAINFRQGEEFLVRQGFGAPDVWANVGYLVVFAWGNRFMSYLVRPGTVIPSAKMGGGRRAGC